MSFRKTSSFAVDFLVLAGSHRMNGFLYFQEIQFLLQFSPNLIQLMSSTGNVS
jgi:hypothetical protein